MKKQKYRIMNKTIKKVVKECKGQVNLAKQCGVSQPTIWAWLHGGGSKAKYIPLIAKASNGKVSEMDILNSLTQDGQ